MCQSGLFDHLRLTIKLASELRFVSTTGRCGQHVMFVFSHQSAREVSTTLVADSKPTLVMVREDMRLGINIQLVISHEIPEQHWRRDTKYRLAECRTV